MIGVRTFAQAMAWFRSHRERVRERWHLRKSRWLVRRRPELVAGLSPDSQTFYRRFRDLSTNRSNQLRMRHDRVMRPLELQGLLLAWLASGEPSQPLTSWLCETSTDAPGLLVAPAPYDEAVAVRDLGAVRMHWYRRAPVAAGPARKLVVAFGSNANAVAMTAPCFLQLLGPFATDVVLVLRERPHQQSFFGRDGASSAMARLLEALPTLVPLAIYDQVVTIGYSGGGFAAAVAAVALGADRGVSLGGWPPQGAVTLDRAWMQGLRSALPPPRAAWPDLRLCCSAGCASDIRGTALARATVDRWDLPVGSLQTRAYRGCRDHNLLVELQRRGYALAPVVADLLFPDEQTQHRRRLLARRARWRPSTPDGEAGCVASF